MTTTIAGLLVGLIIVIFTVYRILAQHQLKRAQRRQQCWRTAQNNLKIVEAQLSNPLIVDFPLAKKIVHRRALLIYYRLSSHYPKQARLGIEQHTKVLDSISKPQPQDYTPSRILKKKEDQQAAHRLLLYLDREKKLQDISVAECEQASVQINAVLDKTLLSHLKHAGLEALEEKKLGSVNAAIEQASNIFTKYLTPPDWMKEYQTVFAEMEKHASKIKPIDLSTPFSNDDHDGLHRMWDNSKHVAHIH